jgi:hypothetical protein
MNRLKKKAWVDLIYWLPILFIYASLIISHFDIPKPTVPNAVRASLLPFLGVFGIWGILVYFSKHKEMQKELDERERQIYNNAQNISGIIFSGLWVACLSLAFIFYDLNTPFPLVILVSALFAFWSIAIFVRALIILIQLNAGRRDE